MKRKEIVVLSLGGSIILTKEGRPDIPFLKSFKELIETEIKKGKQFIIVTGGGSLCRILNEEMAKDFSVSPENLDWLGISVTRVNAQLIKIVFGDLVMPEVVTDPTKKIVFNKKILLSGGWKPGRSTDFVATKLAEVYEANTVINLSNTDYVYDKDPRKFSDAQPIKKINWSRFRKEIVGTKWVPGLNKPFDPIASKLAEKLGLTVACLKGTDLQNLANFLEGRPFNGTVIEK
ncbi:MAG: UMP kinase [Patescibacteria group bacterium]|nr:UMP kinase [Patescibacteria group bacterium]MDD5164771.1 UMP kinase [Patescibacteria group bacterium]MDD5534413.1 UMP kinase [Patescibacteria group bacterium]